MNIRTDIAVLVVVLLSMAAHPLSFLFDTFPVLDVMFDVWGPE